MDLNELRGDIDKIDSELIELFEKRMEISRKVAEYKIQVGKSIFDKPRENQKIEEVKALAKCDENREPTGELFEKIMEISRKRQYERLSESGVTDSQANSDPVYRDLISEGAGGHTTNNSLILYRNATNQQSYLRDNLVILADRKLSDETFTREEQENLIHFLMSILIEESARRGFYGNLWHAFLTLLLVSDENAYIQADMNITVRVPFNNSFKILIFLDEQMANIPT